MDLYSYHIINQHKQSPFKVFHTNIRSLQLNGFALLSYLETLKCEFDVILLTEIGKPNIGFVENMFKGYKLYYQESNRSKGGAGALIKTSNFDSVTVLDGDKFKLNKKCDCTNCEFEDIWLKLTNNGQEFIVGSIYRHPGGNVSHFINAFEHFFNHVKDKHFYLWAGDINIDILKIDSDKKVSDYVTKFIESNFIPCITLPTRFSDVSATLIDHIMVKVPNKHIQTKVTSGNLVTEITDHLSNFVLIDTEIIKEKKRPLVRLFTQRNIDKVQATLNCHPPLINENLNGTLLNDSVNEKFSNLTDNCIKSLNDRFPLVKLSRSKARDKPYITSALKVSIRYKDHLHNQYLNNKIPVNKSKWQNYRRKLSVALTIVENVC